MRHKTGRRLISMALAAQLPLSSVAQAAAPLTLSAQEGTEQISSFQEFIREEEWNTLRLNQTPMWQKLRLVTAGTESDSPAENDPTNDLPSTGEDIPSTPDSGDDDDQQSPDGGDDDAGQQPPPTGGDDDAGQQPPTGGDDDAGQQPPTGGDDDSQQPPGGTGDDDSQQPPGGTGDDDSQQPPGGTNDDDSQQPPGGTNDDSQQPSTGEEGSDDLIPEEGEEGNAANAAMFGMSPREARPIPFWTLLIMKGYGWEYATPGLARKGWGDSVWSDTAKYNLEWEGHTWIIGDYFKPASEYDPHGIMTRLFPIRSIFDEESGEWIDEMWFEWDGNLDTLGEGGYFLRSDIQALFDPANLPRLPNKEFAGWHIQESRTNDSQYFGYSMDDEKQPSTYAFGREGSTVGWDEVNGVPTDARTTAKAGVDDQTEFDYKADMSDYGQYALDHIGEDNFNYNILPVIGVWKDSKNATATDLKLYPSSTKGDGKVTTYPEAETVSVTKNRQEITKNGVVKFYDYKDSLLNLTATELAEKETTPFDSEKTEYFVRVSHDTDRLNFDFTTYEPGSTVVVTATNGATIPDSAEVTGVETTMSYDEGVYNEYAGRHPTNSPANDPNDGNRGYDSTGPARKIFTLGTDSAPVYIDLGVYNASANKPLDTCNVITFTVTAPDGKTTKTYTIHVQRLTNPTMEKDPGNTPYGMIYREAAAYPEKKGDTWREEMKELYQENIRRGKDYFFDGIEFDSSANNGGKVYRGRYRRAAWLDGNNLDEDPTALVVYTNSTFQIPDATVTDALGNSHVASAYDRHVTWSLDLTLVDKLGPEVASDSYTGNPYTLPGDTTSITLPKNVKPGIYTLAYEYRDPYDGGEHRDEDFGFTRKIVVLPLPGDVDMDGAVTVADGIMLRKLIADGAFTNIGDDATKRLYVYRVCNMNSDDKLDETDVSTLLNTFATPAYGATQEAGDYYRYLPLPGGTTGGRSQAVRTQGHTGLTVEYLGVGSDSSNLDASKKPDYDPDPEKVTPFWMGVRLDATNTLHDSLKGDVTTFTFTLVYDPAYVKPWMPDGEDNLLGYILEQNSQWSGYTLLSSSGSGIKPATHLATKATPALSGLESNLQELRFSIQGTEKSLEKTLLKVPFQLTGYPTGLLDAEGKAALVDAALGPRDFTVTTANGAAVWMNTAESISTVTTNLATNLTYNGTEKIPLGENKAPGTIIHVHNTAGDEVNPVYGDKLMDGNTDHVTLKPGDGGTINPTNNRLVDKTKLPPGLEYNDKSVTLTGTPTSAGTYTFTVESGTGSGKKNFDFVITIDKAPLTLTATDVTMYYGQETTASNTTAQTFTYNTTQIKANDLKGDKANTGKAEDLSDLLNKAGDDYTAPQINLRTEKDKDGALATSATEPGKYWVTLSGGSSKNYKFSYVQPADSDSGAEDETDPDWGWATLTVKPRPILVDQLTKESLGDILSSATNPLIEGNTVRYTDNEFKIKTPAVTNLYDNIPLTTTAVVNSDELVLEYSVQVKNWPVEPTGTEELFDAEVIDVRLAKAKEGETPDNKNSCYVLVNINRSTISGHLQEDGWVRPDNWAGKVTVKARETSKMEVQWNDLIREYTYGIHLDLSKLAVKLTYKELDGQDGRPEKIGGETWIKGEPGTGNGVIGHYETRGLTVQWVDSEGAAPAPVDPDKVGTVAYEEYYPDMAYTGQPITVAEHNGKWLCITVQGSGLDPIYMGPFTVEKKTLTLKMSPTSRYYGEENPVYPFSYALSDLAVWDQTYEKDGETVTPSENDTGLATNPKITGYGAPTITFRTAKTLTGGEAVTSATGVGERYVLLSGAKSDNYTFQYQGIGATPTDDVGVNTLTIKPRPIMVTKINAPAGSLVYNAKSNVVEKVTATVVNTSDENARSGYVAVLPGQGINDRYYQKDGPGFKEYIKTHTLTGDPIRSGDSVTVQYTATYKAEDGGTPGHYWNLGDNEPSREVDVYIEDLTLTDEGQGSNYELIFAGGGAAMNGYTAERNPASAETEPSARFKINDSKGNIVRREIKTIQVVHGPTLQNYQYGGKGSEDSGKLNLAGLRVKITYANGEYNFVDYGTELNGGEATSTFAREGLTVHWGAADGAEAKSYDILNVTDHNGKELVITGRAAATHDEVVATLAAGVSTTITVTKRALVLTASDQTRAYGEENGVYKFTFKASDLAEWDKKLLEDQGLTAEGSASSLHTAATSAALTAIDPTFKGPVFDTDAGKTSPVGDHDLYLDSTDAEMANYRFRVKFATIHVEKRPIYLAKAEDIKKDPLHSVAAGAPLTGYSTTCYAGKNDDGTEAEDLILSRNTNVGQLPTTGDALVADDRVAVKVTLEYTSTDMEAGLATKRVGVTVKELQLIEGDDNYSFDGNVGTALTTIANGGELHDKRIEEIRFVRSPKVGYSYGDTLALEPVDIRYENEDSFLGRGEVGDGGQLTAYYCDSATVRALQNREDWSTFPAELAGCREAKPGDHLTIANDSGFAHNGKYILVLAKRSLEENSGYARPIVVGPITVEKRSLTYTLAAESREYDATTKTKGSITFTNVYRDPVTNVGDRICISGYDYNNSQIPDGYTYTSENSNVTFTFTDPNVADDIQVNVSGIVLAGPDADNYKVESSTVTDRNRAPRANITKTTRQAMHQQDPNVRIDLTVDEHTNTVKVEVDRPASAFGNPRDQKNGQLHYEYQLVPLDENGNVLSDFDPDHWQTSPYFGGEQVGDGAVQGGLPRGRYLAANVRLCATHNYLASDLTNSVTGTSDQPIPADALEAITAAQEAWAEAAGATTTQDKNRVVERTPGPVTRTYLYRVDLYDSTEVKNENQTIYQTTLVDVWFTDIAQYPDQQSFERLVDNLAENLYTGYFWDKGRKVSLTYGDDFDMSQDITVKLSVEQPDGTTVEENVLVNPLVDENDPLSGRNLTVYVTTVPRADNTHAIKGIEIVPDQLTVRLGDAPVQLELILTPKKASTRNLRWSSSDPSVATVDKNGLVTFVGPGVAVITVQTRNGNVSASITVQVLEKTPHPYEDAMFNTAYEDAYMDVDSMGAFGPENTMTRGTMVTIMARFFQMIDTVYPKEFANIYSDVPGDIFCLEQLNLLDRWGIISGIGENHFAPDDAATRAEVAVVLCKMLMLPVGTDPDVPHAFLDATPENHWAWAYIDALAAAGITVGTGGGCYSPDDPVTRAELATFIANILATKVNLEAPDLLIPIDVPADHWAYLPILRAVNSGAMLLMKEFY